MSEERHIVNLKGKTKNITCLGCDREKGLFELGNIVKSEDLMHTKIAKFLFQAL